MHAFKIEKKSITKSMAGIWAYKTHAHYAKKKKKNGWEEVLDALK